MFFLDPTTKEWLKTNLDSVFGYPSIVRFSWKTCDTILNKSASSVCWSQYDQEEEEIQKQDKKVLNHPRFKFLSDNNLKIVSEL